MKEQELIIKLKTLIKTLPQDKARELERLVRALWHEAEQAKQERREAEQTLSVSASKVKQAEHRAEVDPILWTIFSPSLATLCRAS